MSSVRGDRSEWLVRRALATSSLHPRRTVAASIFALPKEASILGAFLCGASRKVGDRTIPVSVTGGIVPIGHRKSSGFRRPYCALLRITVPHNCS